MNKTLPRNQSPARKWDFCKTSSGEIAKDKCKNRKQRQEKSRDRHEKDHSMRRSLFFCMLAVLCMTGCVNQHAEIAKYRSILNADIEGEVPPLEPHEKLTMLRALLLANQDNENLMIRGEDFIQAMNDKDRAFSQFLPTSACSRTIRSSIIPKPNRPVAAAPGRLWAPSVDLNPSAKRCADLKHP